MPKKTINMQCNLTEQDAESAGSLWEVSVLVEGKSANGPYYPADVLQKCYERVDGINSYLYQIRDGLFHLPDEFQREHDNTLLGNVIGWFNDSRVDVIDGKTAIISHLYIHKAAKSVRDFFVDCWEHGKQIGFSITALAEFEFKEVAGNVIEWITDLWFMSADPVSHPAVAGAQAIRLLESTKEVRNPIMEELRSELTKLAQLVTPDITVQEDLDRIQAVALVTQIIESLSPNLFPDAPFRDKLVRLRDAIEHERDGEAGELLKNLIALESKDMKTKLESLAILVKDAKWDDAKESISTLLSISEAIDDGDEEYPDLVDTLKKIQMMIQDEEIEAADKALSELIKMIDKDAENPEDTEELPLPPEGNDNEYPLPMPEPELEPEDEYPLPPGNNRGEEEDNLDTVSLEKELDKIMSEEHEKEVATVGESVDVRAGRIKESADVRTARIELERMLETTNLPDKTREKITRALDGKEVSKRAIQEAIRAETQYLRDVGVNLSGVSSASQKAIDAAVDRTSDVLNTEVQGFKTIMAESQQEVVELKQGIEGAFAESQQEVAELKQGIEGALAEYKNLVTSMKEEAEKANTKQLLENLLPLTPLPQSSAKRIREQFDNTTASKEEIKEAIQKEATMANEVLGELTSTVLGFGDDDKVPTNEVEARKSVEDFFGERLGV